MNCKIIARQDLHEKYALGQLAGVQLTAYETHIKACPACQSESESELTLIAGLKDFGRARMKDEIREQASSLENHRSGWTWDTAMKLAAAAVFLIMTPTLYFVFRTSASHEMAVTSLSEQPVRDLAGPVRDQNQAEQEAIPKSPSKKSKMQAQGDRSRNRKEVRQRMAGKKEQAKVVAPPSVETRMIEAPVPIRSVPLAFKDNDSLVAALQAGALAKTDDLELPQPEQDSEDEGILQQAFLLEARNLQSKPNLAEEVQPEMLDELGKQSGPRREVRRIAPTLMAVGELYVYQRPPPAPEEFAASSAEIPLAWRFVAKEKVIVVNFSSGPEIRSRRAKFDQNSFDVHLIELDSTRIVMSWDLPAEIFTDLHGRMTIERLDNRLVVRVAEGKGYEITLLKPNSQAIPIKTD